MFPSRLRFQGTIRQTVGRTRTRNILFLRESLTCLRESLTFHERCICVPEGPRSCRISRDLARWMWENRRRRRGGRRHLGKAGESMIGKSRVEKLQEFPQNFSALQAKGQLQL